MRLLWLTNIPSPYRVDFFNELGKSCELTVLFERAGAADRDSSWLEFAGVHFEARFLRGRSWGTEASASPEVLKYLRGGNYDAIVVTNFSSPTGILAIAYMKAMGMRYFLESDGGFPNGSWLKMRLKRLIIPGADGYFSSSEANDEYFRYYGVPHERLIRYPFTSVRASEVLDTPPGSEQKSAAKRKLGLVESSMVLSVGQFIPRKGFDVLLRACASLGDDTAVCIVGGDPPTEYVEQVGGLGLASVRFVEFTSRRGLDQYYAAADIFVLPTREDVWGLVVNEALAHAVPVVTTDRCGAGLEMVVNNGCGLIVPADDPDQLELAILELLRNPDVRMDMSARALEVSRKYTIEGMSERHEEVFRARCS